MLIDLSDDADDIDRALTNIMPGFADILARRAPVPGEGYWQPDNGALVDATMSLVVGSWVSARRRLDDQVRCLEAAVQSPSGFGIIKYLQPDFDGFHKGTQEDKEAFMDRVKAADKQFVLDRTAANRKAAGGNKGRTGNFAGKRGLTPAQSKAVKQSQNVVAASVAGGKGGKGGKVGQPRPFKGNCRTCQRQGHMAKFCPGKDK